MIRCKLAEVLRRKGWTRYRLQKESGITYPTLHALFHDRTKSFDRAILNRLCSTLHCKPADLLEWKPDRFPRLKPKRK
jgi:DNA-binding Xre family transcriptional regulator